MESQGYTTAHPTVEVLYRDGKVIPKFVDTKPKEKEISKNTVLWRDVLYDFSQASTIHGLNHITEDTPFRIRRIIWIFLVFAGTCLFALQVVQSVLLYYSRPVTVNVKVNYNDTLVFPAVTICNQNSFRITQSVKHGYYDMLTKAFSSHHHEDEAGSGSRGHHDQFGDEIKEQKETELHKLFEQIAMDDVYNNTSHTIADMVISCQWDGRPCDPGDIVSTSTDHGACMTFNGGTKTKVKKVTRIGSNGGLRLRLNIEQYEYMSGPIEGAGIKILLHDQEEIPMVRYLGQAIPPGAHALVGLSIMEVGNLKYPYGRCSDDKKLEYYDHYSVSACLLDCRQKFLIKVCECRDVYMRPGAHPDRHNDTVPICTLNQYLTCLVKHLESEDFVTENSKSYEVDEEECTCPIPCKQTIYDPTITHATLSHFDRQKILLTDKQLRDKLQRKYHAARETRQRADADILKNDEERLLKFLRSASKLESTFEDLLNLSKEMIEKLEAMSLDWQTNYHFHRWGALAFMEYIIKHNFNRGWEVIEERTFRYLTFDYLAFLENIDLNLEELVRIANMTEESTSYRDVITWEIKKNLALRVDVTERGLSNMTKIYEGYSTGKLLSIYKYTKIAKYDNLYTPLCLQSELIETRSNTSFSKMEAHLLDMIDTLYGLLNITHDVCEGRAFNNATFRKLSSRFIKKSKSINYRLFIYKDRVVDYALHLTQDKLQYFDRLTSKVADLKHQLHLELHIVEGAIAKFLDTDWKYIENAMNMSRQYLYDRAFKKSQLSDAILSEKLQLAVQGLQKVIPDVRARARNLKDITRKLEEAVIEMYHSILMENCSNVLYGYLREDIERIRQNRSHFNYKMRYMFTTLLKNLPVPKGGEDPPYTRVRNMSADELTRLTNANLPSVPEMDLRLKESFLRFEQDHDFNKGIDNADVNFTNVLRELKDILTKYKTDGQINTDFLRDNILNVDVFLRELSYEEIQQQRAYELTNLWSDIGGSLGLFIGASVLTLAELIDVIIHTFLRKHAKKLS